VWALVGRHRLEYTVSGRGTPVVVIEPGFGGRASGWSSVAARIAQYTTVLTYDRAAYGRSSRATDRRTPDQIAHDLRGVLDAAGVACPVVLVGHSFGGIVVRAYAAAFEDDVAGMVLVDASTEGQDRVLGPVRSRRMRFRQMITPAQLLLSRSSARNGADRHTILREWRTLHRDMAPHLAEGGFGDRPLVVLTQAPLPELTWWQSWHDMHVRQTELSTRAVHVVATTPGHYIHRVQPDLVAHAVQAVVDAVRFDAPLTMSVD
jgi:pimeloyl-ACP methyl ester carboxylesterase